MPEGTTTAAGGHTATTNSTTDQPTLAVTQADREAFARLEGHEPGDMGWAMIVVHQRCDNSVGVQAFARHRTTHEPRPAGDLREAIRKAKLAADEVHGIDWHKLEEISRFELVQSFLATHVPAPMEGWRRDMNAAKHGGHVVLNSDSPLWRYPFVGFWNADTEWWEFSDPNMAGCFSVSELVNQWSPLPVAAHPATQEGADCG